MVMCLEWKATRWRVVALTAEVKLKYCLRRAVNLQLIRRGEDRTRVSSPPNKL